MSQGQKHKSIYLLNNLKSAYFIAINVLFYINCFTKYILKSSTILLSANKSQNVGSP